MEINLSNKCRACLSEEEDVYSLYEDFNDGITLINILETTTNFEIDANDEFSKILCHNCANILVEFYNFKTIYITNEKQIKELLSQAIPIDDDSIMKMENEIDNTLVEEIANSDDLETYSETEGDDEDPANFITIKIEESSSETDDKTALKCSEQYTCIECGEDFLYESEINQHFAETQHGIDQNCQFTTVLMDENASFNPIICKICQEQFATSTAYKTHFETHKKHICDICGAGFVKRSYLKSHQEVHFTDKRYVCNFCDKAFKRRTVLVKHKRIHTHPRQCVCDQCGKAFNDRGTLKTHILLLHIKERNYVCDICNSTFPLKATLEKHLRRHQRIESGFTCVQCSRAYRDKCSLDRHIYSKHSGKDTKLPCKNCGRIYSSKSSLSHHTKNCHLNLVPTDEELANLTAMQS